jgi:nicotinamide mononucleotide (NMN) deamidase PncC
MLARVPGASDTILECVVPYSNQALSNFLGFIPDKCASLQTAIDMARESWKRGVRLATQRNVNQANVLGVGITGVVGTNRILKGKHRVYVAAYQQEKCFVVEVEFQKTDSGTSRFGRKVELLQSDYIALNLILFSAGIDQILMSATGMISDDFEFRGDKVILKPRSVSDLKNETVASSHALYLPDGKKAEHTLLTHDKHVLFSGSFNPLHDGHKQIADEVQMVSGKEVVFILCADHPYKGVVPDEDIQRRVQQFAWHAPALVLRRCSLYIEMAEAFPGFSFVLGADTLKRLLDQKYYTEFTVLSMLKRFQELKTRFYVARRDEGAGVFPLSETLKSVPEEFHALFTELSVVNSLSSTQLRKITV